MKLSLIIGLAGVTCVAASSFGQGVISLDNYDTSGPLVTYGSPGIEANGSGGAQGVVGSGLLAGWTLGFYYALGDVTGSIAPDPSGFSDPFTLGGGLVLASGIGSTASFYTSSFATPGEAFSSNVFSVLGTPNSGGTTITMLLVAYAGGSSYASATYRGHSAPFTMITSANTSPIPSMVGSFMPAFSILAIPEPSITAFAALGGVAFVFFSRQKKSE